jgi:NitT/TauT family transport system substrate-binding protein
MRRQHAPSHRWPTIAIALLISVALAACGQAAPAAAPAEPPTAVQIQLGWVHEYSSAGFYAAEKHGHFAKQNLAATLAPGGFGADGYIDPIALVTSGEADFGIASAASLIQARAAGQPVVGIAAIFQRSPSAIITLDTSGIQRPQDLIGRRVAVAESAMGTYNLLLTSQRIDTAAVNTVPRESFGIEPLTAGEVDAMYAWVINEGVQLREAGHSPTMLLLSDYGVETYDLVLFTSERMVADSPAVVERVLRASLQGWEDVVANPAEAAQLTLAYDPALDLAGQQRRIEAALPLLRPAGSQIGSMQPEVWETTQQILIEQRLLDKPIDLSKAYTQAFLDTAGAK